MTVLHVLVVPEAAFQSATITQIAEFAACVVIAKDGPPVPLVFELAPMPSDPENVSTFAVHGAPLALPVNPSEKVWLVDGMAVHA